MPSCTRLGCTSLPDLSFSFSCETLLTTPPSSSSLFLPPPPPSSFSLTFAHDSIHKCHADEKDKEFELELTWICAESKGRHVLVPEALAAEADLKAKQSLLVASPTRSRLLSSPLTRPASSLVLLAGRTRWRTRACTPSLLSDRKEG